LGIECGAGKGRAAVGGPDAPRPTPGTWRMTAAGLIAMVLVENAQTLVNVNELQFDHVNVQGFGLRSIKYL
jgi:hypothetical protein